MFRRKLEPNRKPILSRRPALYHMRLWIWLRRELLETSELVDSEVPPMPLRKFIEVEKLAELQQKCSAHFPDKKVPLGKDTFQLQKSNWY